MKSDEIEKAILEFTGAENEGIYHTISGNMWIKCC